MTIEPISGIAMMQAMNPVSYYNSNAGFEIQRQRQEAFSSGSSSASKSIIITDKLELSSDAQVNLNLEDLRLLITKQPQLNKNAPVNKTQYSFKSILDSKKELTAEELLTSIDTRRKNARTAKESAERADAANLKKSKEAVIY